MLKLKLQKFVLIQYKNKMVGLDVLIIFYYILLYRARYNCSVYWKRFLVKCEQRGFHKELHLKEYFAGYIIGTE